MIKNDLYVVNCDIVVLNEFICATMRNKSNGVKDSFHDE
jgi:hypothetical protein